MTRQSVLMRIADVVKAPTSSLHKAEPCVLIIFGAGGDLTKRKLVPALYHLRRDGLLPDDFAVIGVAREPFDDGSFREAMAQAVREFAGGEVSPGMWDAWAQRLWYVHGELDADATYAALREKLAAVEGGMQSTGRLFYLAIPPLLYEPVLERLGRTQCAPRVHDARTRPFFRVIIEKPFGTSLDTARTLNSAVRKSYAEHQVYRIDHYLGKETVQNLMVFRFANSIFEPVWNRQHIDHVQITAAETVGVERRGRYYEGAGVVRDMFQNHLLQLLTLTAMEPPSAFTADAVRDEKVKVLRAIRPIGTAELHDYTVRGQYGQGTSGGKPVPGYRQEPDVAPDSTTPTFAAIRFMVDNWRWQGVPFYLRSAKRMPRRASEIAITFRRPPHLMFTLPEGQELAPNVLAIRVQPEEGIALRFEVKVPGVEMKMVSVDMDFEYTEAFGEGTHEAYETLLLDAMLGDATLFTRADEVEAAWTIVDPVLEAWAARRPDHFPNYAAGSWGPDIAHDWIRGLGATWREP